MVGQGLEVGGESRNECRCYVPEVHILNPKGVYIVSDLVDGVP